MVTVEHVDALSSAYVKVNDSLYQVEKQILEDGKAGLPLFIPGDEHLNDQAARFAAIQSISRLRADSSLVKSGVLCASKDTVALIEQFNLAKDQFKETVQSVKGGVKKTSKALQHMIQANATTTRDSALAAALKAMGALSFDLRTCYAHVRVLPVNTQSVSWTWAMKHKRIVKFTVPEAFELASRMTDDRARLAAEIQLKQLSDSETLIQKVDMPPQLKANIKFMDSNEQLVKKSITVSGVLIAPQTALPETVWREQPKEQGVRLNRPKMREDEVFIPTLGLYRYAGSN